MDFFNLYWGVQISCKISSNASKSKGERNPSASYIGFSYNDNRIPKRGGARAKYYAIWLYGICKSTWGDSDIAGNEPKLAIPS